MTMSMSGRVRMMSTRGGVRIMSIRGRVRSRSKRATVRRMSRLGRVRSRSAIGFVPLRMRSKAPFGRMMPAPEWRSNPPGPMSFAVALSRPRARSCVSPAFACFRSATTPAATGHAAEVPLSELLYPR